MWLGVSAVRYEQMNDFSLRALAADEVGGMVIAIN